MKEKRSQKADFSEKTATWKRHSGELFRLGSRCKTGRAEGLRRHTGGAALRAHTGIRRKNPLRAWENASSVYRRQSDAASGRKRKNAAERKAHGGAAECVRSSLQPGAFRERFFPSAQKATPRKNGSVGARRPENRRAGASNEKGEGSLPPLSKASATIRRCGSCPQRSSGADARTSGRRSHLHRWGWRWSWWSSLHRRRRGRRGAGRS